MSSSVLEDFQFAFIDGPDGKLAFRRPVGHPDVAWFRRVPGYVVRIEPCPDWAAPDEEISQVVPVEVQDHAREIVKYATDPEYRRLAYEKFVFWQTAEETRQEFLLLRHLLSCVEMSTDEEETDRLCDLVAEACTRPVPKIKPVS
jgi:hypothetical protein